MRGGNKQIGKVLQHVSAGNGANVYGHKQQLQILRLDSMKDYGERAAVAAVCFSLHQNNMPLHTHLLRQAVCLANTANTAHDAAAALPCRSLTRTILRGPPPPLWP